MMVKTLTLTGLALLLSLGMLAPHSARAAWSTVGTAGEIDEVDVGQYQNSGASLYVKSTLAAATVTSRFNVSHPGYAERGCFRMRVRYSDNGSGAKVYLRLMRRGLFGGYTKIAEFDSDRFAQTGWRTEESAFQHNFDFTNHTYYLEAWVNKYNSSGVPAVSAIQIYGQQVC